jgi:hypothetical protein
MNDLAFTREVLAMSLMRSCSSRLVRPLKKKAKKLVKVITPRPPSWINRSRTHWPSSVRSLPTSITLKPVTQTALVLVNKASTNVIGRVPVLGNKNNAAPIAMSITKLTVKSNAGLKSVLLRPSSSLESSMKKNPRR